MARSGLSSVSLPMAVRILRRRPLLTLTFSTLAAGRGAEVAAVDRVGEREAARGLGGNHHLGVGLADIEVAVGEGLEDGGGVFVAGGDEGIDRLLPFREAALAKRIDQRGEVRGLGEGRGEW